MELNQELAVFLKLPILLFIVLAIAACDAQVDGNHNGTALARLEGAVQNMRAQGVEGAEVAILWSNSSGDPDFLTGDTVEVEGDFPATFRLSLYAPPDDMLINSYPHGSRIGIAYIYSGETPASCPDGLVCVSLVTKIFGMGPDHLLIYLPADVAAGSFVSTPLRGTPRAGFHLYNVDHLAEEESQERQACEDQLPAGPTLQDVYDACGGSPTLDDLLPSPTDLETTLQVGLVDHLGELDVPNWT